MICLFLHVLYVTLIIQQAKFNEPEVSSAYTVEYI